MKTYTTKTAKGNELRFEISYNKEVVEVERNLDGYIVNSKWSKRRTRNQIICKRSINSRRRLPLHR